MEYESLVNTSTSIGAQSEINLGPGLRHRPLLRGHQVHHLTELRQLAETSLSVLEDQI